MGREAGRRVSGEGGSGGRVSGAGGRVSGEGGGGG